MKLLVSGLVFLAVFCFVTIGTANKNSKHILLIALDGISYQTAMKMYDDGLFREFKRPIPMVATFPSLSDPNWAHLMNAPLEKGYTKAGFDPKKNEEYGTLIDHITTPPQYEKNFDYKAEGVLEHFVGMTWSETSALFWTDSLLIFLLEPKNIKNKNITTAFTVNTDIISHLGGEKKVIEYLKNLEEKIKTLRKDFKAQYKKNLEVVIVSDHGNHFKVPTPIDYIEPLKKSGFMQKTILKEKFDYAFVAPEIISFGAFYTLPNQEQLFAEQIAKVDGVHVALAEGKTKKLKNSVVVYSKNSKSEIFIDSKNKKISYKVHSGNDPFDQIQLFKSKSELSFDEYFYKTLNTTYPNALLRAWEGFHKNSQDKASVLVSAKLGHVFTNLALQIITAVSGVQSTHGSFHREESFGVVMSTLPFKEEALTPFDFYRLLKTEFN